MAYIFVVDLRFLREDPLSILIYVMVPVVQPDSQSEAEHFFIAAAAVTGVAAVLVREQPSLDLADIPTRLHLRRRGNLVQHVLQGGRSVRRACRIKTVGRVCRRNLNGLACRSLGHTTR